MQELLALAIPEIRERFKSQAKEIIVPSNWSGNPKGVDFTIPQRGDKKTLARTLGDERQTV